MFTKEKELIYCCLSLDDYVQKVSHKDPEHK